MVFSVPVYLEFGKDVSCSPVKASQLRGSTLEYFYWIFRSPLTGKRQIFNLTTRWSQSTSQEANCCIQVEFAEIRMPVSRLASKTTSSCWQKSRIMHGFVVWDETSSFVLDVFVFPNTLVISGGCHIRFLACILYTCKFSSSQNGYIRVSWDMLSSSKTAFVA